LFSFLSCSSFFFSFSLHFFLKIIKHIKVIQCQGKWTWITWGDKFMEFGSHHHTCFLQLQVFKNSFFFLFIFPLPRYFFLYFFTMLPLVNSFLVRFCFWTLVGFFSTRFFFELSLR
jgi:hypothetical protein